LRFGYRNDLPISLDACSWLGAKNWATKLYWPIFYTFSLCGSAIIQIEKKTLCKKLGNKIVQDNILHIQFIGKIPKNNLQKIGQQNCTGQCFAHSVHWTREHEIFQKKTMLKKLANKIVQDNILHIQFIGRVIIKNSKNNNVQKIGQQNCIGQCFALSVHWTRDHKKFQKNNV